MSTLSLTTSPAPQSQAVTEQAVAEAAGRVPARAVAMPAVVVGLLLSLFGYAALTAYVVHGLLEHLR